MQFELLDSKLQHIVVFEVWKHYDLLKIRRRYFESTASTEFFHKIIFFDFVCRYFESNTGTDIFLKGPCREAIF